MANRSKSRRYIKVSGEFRARCEADRLPCWLCGMGIDYAAPHDDYKNDERFQLDHFHPWSTHPELREDPSNFRPSHAGCNRERSNGSPRPPLGIPSRQWS